MFARNTSLSIGLSVTLMAKGFWTFSPSSEVPILVTSKMAVRISSAFTPSNSVIPSLSSTQATTTARSILSFLKISSPSVPSSAVRIS